MHGIVDPDAEGGNHTTELPVAFHLRTAYKLRDGKDLHLMIGLGKNVSVKFSLGNPWLKSIGTVVDYRQDCLRAPLYSREGQAARDRGRSRSKRGTASSSSQGAEKGAATFGSRRGAPRM